MTCTDVRNSFLSLRGLGYFAKELGSTSFNICYNSIWVGASNCVDNSETGFTEPLFLNVKCNNLFVGVYFNSCPDFFGLQKTSGKFLA